MACLERWVRQSNPDAPNLAAQKELDSGQWYRLYEVIVRLDPLRELFASKPGFSEADATVIANYASFADARPDVETVFRTTDVLFICVLRLVLGPVPPTATSILHADFTKLIMLYSAYPQETAAFLDFVRSASFHPDWSTLEQRIDLLRRKPNHADPTQQDDKVDALAIKIIHAVPNINENGLQSMAESHASPTTGLDHGPSGITDFREDPRWLTQSR